jgi:hypothetical protein
MNNQLETMWENAWPLSKYYISIYLEGLRKTTKTFGEDGQYAGQASNWAPSKHKSEALSPDPNGSTKIRQEEATWDM